MTNHPHAIDLINPIVRYPSVNNNSYYLSEEEQPMEAGTGTRMVLVDESPVALDEKCRCLFFSNNVENINMLLLNSIIMNS